MESTNTIISTNPWENVYWFSRMLINSDKYGGIGADSKSMMTIANAIKSVAKALLDTKGVKGLSNIINLLDDIGLKGCMAVERQKIVQSFRLLRKEIVKFLSEGEINIVLTSFCQEFERRAG